MENAAQVLTNRLKKLLNSDLDTLTVFLSMLDFLLQCHGALMSNEIHLHTTKLCEGLTTIFSPFMVLPMLGHPVHLPYRHRFRCPDSITLKILTAIAVEDLDMDLTLLPPLPNAVGWGTLNVRTTFEVAVARGSELVLRGILRWLEVTGVQGSSLKDVLTTDKHGFELAPAIHFALA